MTSDPNYYRNVSEIVDRTLLELPPTHRPGRIGVPSRQPQRVLLRLFLWLAVALGILYIGDYAAAQIRRSESSFYGNVTVERYYAIQKKGGRTEFSYQGTEAERCIQSAFPHFGYPPCWYARRHTEKRTNL